MRENNCRSTKLSTNIVGVSAGTLWVCLVIQYILENSCQKHWHKEGDKCVKQNCPTKLYREKRNKQNTPIRKQRQKFEQSNFTRGVLRTVKIAHIRDEKQRILWPNTTLLVHSISVDLPTISFAALLWHLASPTWKLGFRARLDRSCLWAKLKGWLGFAGGRHKRWHAFGKMARFLSCHCVLIL
jgi:hypothetical protein